MDQATAMLGLLAETSLHAGAGKMVGVIDLPIQREAPTHWPCVFGSAVKGALRTRAAGQPWEAEVFGPDTRNASDHAGALAVGDARLVLLPVRSLTSHFRWVSCPAALRRLERDAARLGQSLPMGELTVSPGQALVPGSGGRPLFLEDHRFETHHHDLGPVVEALARVTARADAERALREQLAVVCDDAFSLLSRFATPVAAHVRLLNETKTVDEGALWYEETLPPETLLVVSLAASPSRKGGSALSAKEVLNHVCTDLFGKLPYLQLGGNETVGMGWCQVKVLGGPQ